MLPQAIALLGAVFFSVNHILVKKGMLAGGTPTVCTMINIASNAVFLWMLAAFLSPLGAITAPQALIFVLVGILTPGLARIAFFVGIDRVGVSRTTAVTGTAPIFSSFIAILVLLERPDLFTVLGTLSIVSGLIVLSLEQDERITWKRTDLLFPLAASVLFGTRDNLTRFAFRAWPHPLLGSAIATASATAFIVAINLRSLRRGRLSCSRSSFLYFAISGIAAGFSYVCFYIALSMAPVTQVAPLLYTVNIFSVILSYFFLKESELLTLRVAISALVIFAGIILITAL